MPPSATPTDGPLLDAPVTLRPLVRADLPLLQRWLAAPHVHRWWFHETTDEALERDFGAGLRGEEPGEDLVAELGGVPVGLVQRACWADHPDDVAQVRGLIDLPPGALEIDYLIGPVELTGRGLGPRIIAAAVTEGWERYPDATAVVVPVAAGNRTSWRALEKAGFRRIATGELPPDNPADPPLSHVLRLDRPARPSGMMPG
ncbi:Aminoglycoside 6'-N-acetyltransferase [Pseudonocardia sp. Ae406_Ps2]|uniref:GNAT family N-acetyltransferase n=1 Tax=unclassified Pseudonocardia TaxID=2619320 RepID=UPI00094B1828|nr:MULTISPECIES: GNAT family N-acetyltransferase [unclassified Pseudonocardia]OLM01505.1 Aminoglycoside 6'-N-acetyltransferase [Pseudonocardia sp. Ae406_Ps2]OLM06693.1 Aminoglycoside 6'-N-acetyltransferase [Pseudonocardia sp. Ae331_Ps2]OLM23076.1 Aminoglycoside 6'-N-acetyltransferase [Pseudonocardia sp. Ae706_Ps2]